MKGAECQTEKKTLEKAINYPKWTEKGTEFDRGMTVQRENLPGGKGSGVRLQDRRADEIERCVYPGGRRDRRKGTRRAERLSQFMDRKNT